MLNALSFLLLYSNYPNEKVPFFALIFVCIYSFTNKEVNNKPIKIFNILDEIDSGILFNNTLRENDSLNYFTYDYIYRARECLSQQIPAIKSKFKDYSSFSTATLIDVYTEESLENSLHHQVKSFSSIYLKNQGDSFVKHELPIEAQISSINKIVVDDNDSNLDIVAVGNLYSSEVETPRNDASNGLLLKGNVKGVSKQQGL